MDLLVPLGLYFIADALLEGLAAISVVSSVLTPSWSLKILSLSISFSLLFVLQIVIGVWFAGWTTILILQAVRQDHVDPVQGFAAVPSRFWRVLGVEALGWVVLFTVVGVAITVGVVVLPLALLVIAIFSLIWNLMTAALLPVVVSERKGFRESVREGIRISWEGKSRWWLPVVAQMVLLGWVTLIVVSYTSNPQPGSFSRQDKANFGINGFWTGGYEDECRWFSKLMEAVDAEPLPLAQFILSTVFTVLAIVAKLEITAKVYPHREIPGDGPSAA